MQTNLNALVGKAGLIDDCLINESLCDRARKDNVCIELTKDSRLGIGTIGGISGNECRNVKAQLADDGHHILTEELVALGIIGCVKKPKKLGDDRGAIARFKVKVLHRGMDLGSARIIELQVLGQIDAEELGKIDKVILQDLGIGQNAIVVAVGIHLDVRLNLTPTNVKGGFVDLIGIDLAILGVGRHDRIQGTVLGAD